MCVYIHTKNSIETWHICLFFPWRKILLESQEAREGHKKKEKGKKKRKKDWGIFVRNGLTLFRKVWCWIYWWSRTFYLHTWKQVREQVNRTNWENAKITSICFHVCLEGTSPKRYSIWSGEELCSGTQINSSWHEWFSKIQCSGEPPRGRK